VIPRSEYIDVTVQAHERGLRFEQGKLVEELCPGRYVLWTFPEAKAEIRSVDMRRQTLTLAGQELMTKDKVTLRLTLTAEYSVVKAATTALLAANPSDSLYLAVQLAARGYLAGVTLDELLEGREALSRFLESQVKPEATALGLELAQVGVKDIVLPGEMKSLFNRVIEAEKEAMANVILRREEVAATRSLANTARVLADNPVLLRLKEFEALKEIAEKIGEVKVVVGTEGFAALLPSELLGGKRKSAS
jgi:regulator of protease activity HflC (stomatin/prohibitin superfamily)